MTARPERVSAEEVKQRMLDAGRDMALETGAALTIEHLLLEEVIQRARVPRSSVYRLWPHREDYVDELLCYLAGPGSWFSDRPVLDPETFTMVKQVLDENDALLATPEGRLAMLREVVRITAQRNYEALTSSAPWRLHMALVATLGSTRSGEASQQIAAALEDAQRVTRESMVALLGYIMERLGLRLRDPAYTLDHVQMAGGLLIMSLAMRNVQVQTAIGEPGGGRRSETSHRNTGTLAVAAHVNEVLNAPIPGPGLDGQPTQWSLVGLAYLAQIEAFIEPDPAFVPPPS
jgi:AcrR family transcriptional regulator